jgi:hypothetical protein
LESLIAVSELLDKLELSDGEFIVVPELGGVVWVAAKSLEYRYTQLESWNNQGESLLLKSAAIERVGPDDVGKLSTLEPAPEAVCTVESGEPDWGK